MIFIHGTRVRIPMALLQDGYSNSHSLFLKQGFGTSGSSILKLFGSIDYVGLGRLVFNQENPVRRRMELLQDRYSKSQPTSPFL